MQGDCIHLHFVCRDIDFLKRFSSGRSQPIELHGQIRDRLKWDASSRWSFGKGTVNIGKTKPTLSL